MDLYGDQRKINEKTACKSIRDKSQNYSSKCWLKISDVNKTAFPIKFKPSI